MHHVKLSGNWFVDSSNAANSTAVGCNNYKNYLKNPMFKFEVVNPGNTGSQVSVRLTARLQCVGGTSFSMNLSVFPLQYIDGVYATAMNASPKRHAVATSCNGVYSDNICGVAVYNVELFSKSQGGSSAPDSNVNTGCYCLLPSTFAPGEVSQFSIDVYVSDKKHIRFF